MRKKIGESQNLKTSHSFCVLCNDGTWHLAKYYYATKDRITGRLEDEKPCCDKFLEDNNIDKASGRVSLIRS